MRTRRVSVHRGLSRYLGLISLSKCFDQFVYIIADTDLAVLNLNTLLGLFYFQFFLDHVRRYSSENIKKVKGRYLQRRSLMSSL